jgi:hypothetical protein
METDAQIGKQQTRMTDIAPTTGSNASSAISDSEQNRPGAGFLLPRLASKCPEMGWAKRWVLFGVQA